MRLHALSFAVLLGAWWVSMSPAGLPCRGAADVSLQQLPARTRDWVQLWVGVRVLGFWQDC